MSVLIPEIAAPLDASEAEVVRQALEMLRIPERQLLSGAVAKTSVDARRRPPKLVHTVELSLDDPGLEERLAGLPKAKLRRRVELPVPEGKTPLSGRVVIAGFGPAGMFAGLWLARRGYRPLILERGGPVEERTAAVEAFWQGETLSPDTNVQFGEGGAGTFSDGKLVTRINDPYCEWVLRAFVEHGAPPELLTRQKPHIGTDRLRQVVVALRREIKELGGEVRFHARMDDLRLNDGRVEAVQVKGDWIPAGALILAVGHSARDTFRMLHRRGLAMEPKPFSVGVRIEHLQADIDRALYGEYAGHPRLPKGEYQLSWRNGGRAVYTFCMCPGGVVVPAASEEGGVVTNGMSRYARDGVNANAAVAVSVGPQEYGSDLFDGMLLQQRLEQAAFLQGGGDYRAPAQTVGRFLAGQPGCAFGRVLPSYQRGVADGDLRTLLGSSAAEMLAKGLRLFDARLPGFAAADAVLTGPETRTSAPLRILRDPDGASGENLYPCGEGAGYAGGITSSAVDGLRAAEALMHRYAVPE